MRKGKRNLAFSELLQKAKETEQKPLYTFKLYNCQAKVYHSEDYLVLKSYNTIVALYDIKSSTEYDFLKVVYGYSPTSVKHISTFINKYIPACYPFVIVNRIKIEKASDIKNETIKK